MTTQPPEKWLDEDRQGHEVVYAKAVHHACVCAWQPTGGGFKLVQAGRKRGCIIHGAKGHV